MFQNLFAPNSVNILSNAECRVYFVSFCLFGCEKSCENIFIAISEPLRLRVFIFLFNDIYTKPTSGKKKKLEDFGMREKWWLCVLSSTSWGIFLFHCFELFHSSVNYRILIGVQMILYWNVICDPWQYNWLPHCGIFISCVFGKKFISCSQCPVCVCALHSPLS